ncbi:MAG: RtcB family protein [Dehalococcoidales bacterium]|nr:RtcB family protein [Dehalococcoidales bacterium]
MTSPWQQVLNKIDDYRWEIPRTYKEGMRVPGLIFASESMLQDIREEHSLDQVVNVAFLPGIVNYSLAMPDIHWGYGFPIGGVAATRITDGVISPGGVGFDINCGVRLLRTNLTEQEVRPRIKQLVADFFTNVPSGLGSEGKIRVSEKELNRVMLKGSAWAVEQGFGEPADITVTEEAGCIKTADPDRVDSKAKKRGIPQLGTLGSGNHFLEIQVLDAIYEPDTARVMGIEEIGQVLVLIHTGSRGLGHQICSDHVALLGAAVKKYGINLPDRQLACAPVESPEGQDYLAAMACAANYAWANRQCIAHWVRESCVKVFNKSRRDLGLEQVYDVAHNIAKIEEHTVDGKKIKLCVHRKGATRAFPAGHPYIPAPYRQIGQPVLIPGDMGRYSFIALGTELAMKQTFGSTCHGAGRLQSRSQAKRSLRGTDIAKALEARGITVMAANVGSLAEEASEAYKDVADVVEVIHQAGISRKIARARPIGVVKG